VASETEASVIFGENVIVEEKIDGASVGMTVLGGEPLIRNRDHILRKGYHKKTAAKQQFASIWNWWYERRKMFDELAEAGPYSVYGEWCVAQHGIYYDKLPNWFIPYDVYNHEKDFFLPPLVARSLLSEIGLGPCPALFDHNGIESYETLARWSNKPSVWTSGSLVEGVYLKVYDDEKITHRFKMVRPDFTRGALWHPKEMTKNKLTNPSACGLTSPASSHPLSD
jgi:hypothetical protein